MIKSPSGLFIFETKSQNFLGGKIMKKVDIIVIGLATLGLERIVKRVYNDMQYSIRTRHWDREYRYSYIPYYKGGYRDYSRYDSETEKDEYRS